MPRQALQAALIALPLLPLLLACAQPPAPPLPRLALPASLFLCAAQPEAPEILTDDAELALFIIDLAAAGEDCRTHLSHIQEALR